MPFKQVVSGPGNTPLSSDLNQLIWAMLGQADVGPLTLAAPIPQPAASALAAGSAGQLSGGYRYIVVEVSGWMESNGTMRVQGFAPGIESIQLTVTSQQINLTNIPTGPVTCIARLVYRTAANGAAGTEKFVFAIADNATTAWTDNIPDFQLGTGMPSWAGTAVPANVPVANTTGTTVTFGAPVTFDSPVYLNGVNNVNSPPTPVILASSNIQGVGMTEFGDLVPINPAQIQNGTYWTVKDKNGNPMWKVYLSGGAIDCEAYWRCYGGLYVPNGQATYLCNGIGSNYTWSGTISSGGNATLSHYLGHYPIVALSGTRGNLELTYSFSDTNNIVISNYSSGSNSWTGTVYLW